MNIFVLDKNPVLAAQYQCCKHVVKMCVETTQLLSNVMYRYNLTGPYRQTHKNHPCSLWAGNEVQNFDWLLQHGLALCSEYTHRYDKQHACESKIFWIMTNFNFRYILPVSYKEIQFVQCMPDQYKNQDPVIGYRNYYMGAKSDIAKWNDKRPKPDWYTV